MNISSYIAKRYLFSKKSHNAINIISFISVLGIGIGTMALIVVLSAFNGLSGLVQSLYTSFDSDIQITVKEGKIFNPSAPEIQKLKSINGVAYFNEILEENALLKYSDRQCIVTVKGVGADYQKASQIDSLVKDGSFILTKGKENYVVVGRGVANVLGASTSDYFVPIQFFSPKRGRAQSVNPDDAINKKSAYVSGIFSVNEEFDLKYAITDLSFARELFEYTNEVSSIEITLAQNADKDEVLEKIKSSVGDKYEVKNRYQQNEILFKTLESEKLWTFIILVFILVIATFNVIGSLTMLIIEKKKDIKILTNMGADISLIRKIFFKEGMMITFVGAISGLLLGTILCVLQQQFKLIKFEEGFIVDAYPVAMKLTDYLATFLVVLSIGFIAAWYPIRLFTKRYFA